MAKQRGYQHLKPLKTNYNMEEPVSLAFLKSYMQIDADYSVDDDVLLMFLSTSRELLEKELNIGLLYRKIKVQWDGSLLELPYSPTGSIISVTKNGGAFTDYSTDNLQAKSIWVNGLSYGFTGDYFYSIANGTVELSNVNKSTPSDLYEVIYNTGYQTLPGTLKLAICAQTDYSFKKRGNPEGGLVCSEALRLSDGFSRNLVI